MEGFRQTPCVYYGTDGPVDGDFDQDASWWGAQVVESENGNILGMKEGSLHCQGIKDTLMCRTF